MNTRRLRRFTDIAMWFLFSFMIGTGLLMQYRLIPGSKGGHGLSLFGMSRHEWGEFHLWSAYFFLGFLCVHLFLNLSFIKNVIAKRTNWRIILLVSGSLIVVGLFLFAPISKKEGNPGHERISASETHVGQSGSGDPSKRGFTLPY